MVQRDEATGTITRFTGYLLEKHTQHTFILTKLGCAARNHFIKRIHLYVWEGNIINLPSAKPALSILDHQDTTQLNSTKP
jgi:hypothetical protein